MRTRRGIPAIASALAAVALLAAGCAATNPPAQTRPDGHSTAHPTEHTATGASGATRATGPSATPKTPAPPVALRSGETMRTVTSPVSYTPKAPMTGTDDYRCFVLDPKLARDAFVTGFDIAARAARRVVHHVILFRVPPAAVLRPRAEDAQSGGEGWTCFGGTGTRDARASLDDAPWLGAWAPGGGEKSVPADVGIPLQRGSQIVMQVHYNLLAGVTSRTGRPPSCVWRRRRRLKPLETMLLPAPVELPCRPGTTGPAVRPGGGHRRRQRALRRRSGPIADLLLPPAAARSPDARTHPVVHPQGRGAGHDPRRRRSHAPARVVDHASRLDPGTPQARTLLDIPVWDFDNQGSVPIPPTAIRPGDTIKVTCTHDQAWRDKLPDLKGLPERYVVWGEGTTDEMCLGLLSVTRP